MVREMYQCGCGVFLGIHRILAYCLCMIKLIVCLHIARVSCSTANALHACMRLLQICPALQILPSRGYQTICASLQPDRITQYFKSASGTAKASSGVCNVFTAYKTIPKLRSSCVVSWQRLQHSERCQPQLLSVRGFVFPRHVSEATRNYLGDRCP